jgi:hypothetical protein
MVLYQCENCKKKFNKKYNFDKHKERKNPCTFREKALKLPVIKCRFCKKEFNRKDALTNHLQVCPKNKNSSNKKIIKQNNNGIALIDSNHNNITNNHVTNIYLDGRKLFPFGQDGVDCLSAQEKISILSPDKNALEMIIFKINLDPDRIEHHNCGIDDLHSGYGIIYDGKKWVTENTKLIMEKLFESKEQDLRTIHTHVEEYVTKDCNLRIKHNLDDISDTIKPINQSHLKSKKNLVAHVKKDFYNNRHLAREAKKRTEQYLHDDKNTKKNDNCINMLREGCTLEDIERHPKKISILKEICMQLLNDSNKEKNVTPDNYKIIFERINSTNSIGLLNLIMNSLVFSAYFNDKIINWSIDDKLTLLKEYTEFEC